MCKAFVPVLLPIYGVSQPWGYPLVSFDQWHLAFWYCGFMHCGIVPARTSFVVSDEVIEWQFPEFSVNCVCICRNTFPPLPSPRVVWVGSFDVPYIYVFNYMDQG